MGNSSLATMKRSKNKEKLCRSGLDLVYRQGFNATGVQEIADVSGVPKGSFYNHFDSKDDFAVQIFEHYLKTTCGHLDAVLVDGPGTPLARLRSLFDGWVEEIRATEVFCGCLAGNLSQEVDLQNETIRPALDAAMAQIESHYAACLHEAQAQKEIGANENPETLAGFIHGAWQGALMRAKAMASDVPLVQFHDVVFGKLLC